MKRIKRLWENIPRKIRVCLNVIATLLTVLTFFYCVGFPVLTLEQGFRRQEKAHLVGPGEIVDHLDWSIYPQFHDVLVAETGHGVSFYAVYEADELFKRYTYEVFSYREKWGNLTVLAPPSMWPNWNWDNWDHDLPIYLFDEYPEAVRAQMDLHVVGRYQVDNDNYDVCDVNFRVEADRFRDGIFRFILTAPQWQKEKLAAAQLLTEISTTGESWPGANSRGHYKEPHADITVRLYDENDSLILEEDLTLRTVSGEAQFKQGDLE